MSKSNSKTTIEKSIASIKNNSSSQEQKQSEVHEDTMAASRKITIAMLKPAVGSTNTETKRTVHKRSQAFHRIRDDLLSSVSSSSPCTSKFSKLTEQEKNCIIERIKAKSAKIHKVSPKDPRQRLDGWLMNLYE